MCCEPSAKEKRDFLDAMKRKGRNTFSALLAICLCGCWCPPVQWQEQTDVQCPECGQVWKVQAADAHIVEARWCCTCGRELVLTSRPCEEVTR